MVKKPGVPVLKNWIKRKERGKHQKTKLTQPVKTKTERYDYLLDENSPEEGLEDTPVVSAQPAPAPSLADRAEAVIEAPPESSQRRTSAKRRKKFALGSVIRSAAASVPRILSTKRQKSKGNTAALAFAESHKRLGRKGRRNRRLLVYAGSVLAAAIVLLLIFFVPGGAAAPVDAPASGSIANATNTISAAGSTGATGTTDSAAATGATPLPTESATLTPTSTPIPTTAPDPTDNPIDMDELLEFYVVEADRYYNDVGYSSNHYEYTQEELHMLAQLIWGEARGQTLNGKIAVANVVMNRVLCRTAFGNTITAVVTAPGQFSGYKATNPTTGCIAAARWVLDYEVWVIPQDVYYFRSASRYSSLEGQPWGGHPYYGEISGHYFYRQNLRGRMRGGDVPPRLFERTYRYAQYGCWPEDRVYRIQFMLDTLGYGIEKVDSYFGEGTREALIKFQQDHGLDDDGVAGPATVRTLIEEYGMLDYYLKFCV